MNLSNAEPGCWIDGSHRSSIEFACLVIEMAHDYGFELEWEQFMTDIEDYHSENLDEDTTYNVLEALDWTYDAALEYLQANTRPGFYWVVEDQSLFLMTEEDADA